jgi:tRNA (guanine10-N2)-methyltransferase
MKLPIAFLCYFDLCKKRQPNEDIKGNLKTYNLFSRYLDVFVGDASTPVWRSNFRFDSIITDRKKMF